MTPFYGLWDTLLGQGIIGGQLTTIEEEAFSNHALAQPEPDYDFDQRVTW